MKILVTNIILKLLVLYRLVLCSILLKRRLCLLMLQTYIQHKSGCLSMKCPVCRTRFCYACGKRPYYHVVPRSRWNPMYWYLFVEDHDLKYSIYGCERRLYPDRPHARRLIRGSLFGTYCALIARLCDHSF